MLLHIGGRDPWVKRYHFTLAQAQWLVRHIGPNPPMEPCTPGALTGLFNRGMADAQVPPPPLVSRYHWLDYQRWLGQVSKNHLWRLSKRGEVLTMELKRFLEENPPLFSLDMV